jgi:hypothetical protein
MHLLPGYWVDKVRAGMDAQSKRWKTILLTIGLSCGVIYLVTFITVAFAASQFSRQVVLRLSETATYTPSFTATFTVTASSTLTPTSTASPTPAATATLQVNCLDADCFMKCMDRLPVIVPQLDPGTPDPSEKPQPGSSLGGVGDIDLAYYLVKGDTIAPFDWKPVVPDRLLPVQNDIALHQELWDYYASIIPAKTRSVLTHFTIFTDGLSGKVAVSFYHYKGYDLLFDPYDLTNPNYMTRTMVHETAHLIEMNHSQMDWQYYNFDQPDDLVGFERAAQQCGAFFNGTLCAHPNSYINQFYKSYWSDISDAWIYKTYRAQHEGDSVWDVAEKLYALYPDEFLGSDAAIDPEEDFVITFVAFIFNQKVDQINASKYLYDKKQLFFYQYPEFVEIRQQIRQNICQYAASH